VNRLRTSEAKTKLVILLTDGVSNAGDLTPENAAQAAKALGIKIYTVGAGASGMVTMPVQDPFGQTQYVRMRSDIDEKTLTQIADATGGKYFRAADLDTLKKVYDEIDRMEKTEIDVEQYTRFEERFTPFLIAGLLCLALDRLASLSRWGRLP
jgi:Ca-activated chloride channel family protein